MFSNVFPLSNWPKKYFLRHSSPYVIFGKSTFGKNSILAKLNFGMTNFGMASFGMTSFGMTSYGLINLGMTRCGKAISGNTIFDKTIHGKTILGMANFGMSNFGNKPFLACPILSMTNDRVFYRQISYCGLWQGKDHILLFIIRLPCHKWIQYLLDSNFGIQDPKSAKLSIRDSIRHFLLVETSNLISLRI